MYRKNELTICKIESRWFMRYFANTQINRCTHVEIKTKIANVLACLLF